MGQQHFGALFFRLCSWPRCVLLGILLAGGAARVWLVINAEMLADEGFSWRLIQYDIGDAVARTARDVHPPLYYIAARGWAALFGSHLIVLRGLSFAASIAAVVLAYKIGKEIAAKTTGRLGMETCGLIAAAGLAFHPLQIVAGYTARMYALGVLLTLVTTWQVLRLSKGGGQYSQMLHATAYGATSAAMCYTHNFGMFVVGAQIIWWYYCVWGHGRRLCKDHLAVIVAVAVLTVSYAPWVPTILQQATAVTEHYWIKEFTVDTALETAATWALGVERSSGIEQAFAAALIGCVFLPTLRSPHHALRVLVYQAAGTWMAVVLVYWITGRSLALPRCFLFAHSAWVIMVGYVVVHSESVFRGALVGSCIAIPVLLMAIDTTRQSAVGGDGFQEVAEIMCREGRAGDVVIVKWRGDVNRVKYFGSQCGHADVDVRLLRNVFRDHSSESMRVHVAALQNHEFVAGYSGLPDTARIWVVERSNRFPRILDRRFRRITVWTAAQGKAVALYEPLNGHE